MFTDIALPHPCSPSHWEIFTKEKSAIFFKNPKLKTRLSGPLFGYNEVFVLVDQFVIFLHRLQNSQYFCVFKYPRKVSFPVGRPTLVTFLLFW